MRLYLFFLIYLFLTALSNAHDSPVEKREYSVDEQEDRRPKKTALDRLKVRGDLRFSFRVAKQRARGADNVGGFEISQVNVRVKYQLYKRASFRGRYRITPYESEVRTAYIRAKDQWGFDTVRMGLQKRFFALDSELQTENLNEVATYDLRDIGLVLHDHFHHSLVYWRLSLMNGGRLDTSDISPRRRVQQDVILSDELDDRQALGSTSREVGMGVGYLFESKSLRYDFLLFANYSPISDDDATDFSTLGDVPGDIGINTGNTTYQKLGANFSWESPVLKVYNQYQVSRIRDLQRWLLASEWNVRRGKYQWSAGYSEQRLSIDPEPEFPLSWTRQRLTLGVIHQMRKRAEVRLEVTLNAEDTGGGDVTNDEGFVMWIYTFK